MSCRRAQAAALLYIWFFALSGGCARRASERTERLALLPFENLTSDSQLDWLTNAIPGTLALQLATAPDLNPTILTAPRDVAGTRATRALFGYFTNPGGRLRLAAQIRDVSGNKTLRVISVESEPGAPVLPLIDGLARELFAGARPAPRHNETAVRDYWQSVATDDPALRTQLLERALATDPSFAPAHLAVIQMRIAARDTAGAAAAIVQARRHAAGFTPLDQARLELAEGRTRNDVATSKRALIQLSRLTPASDDVWRSLGDLELAGRDFAAAAAAYERSLERDPGHVVTLNTLAYAKAFAGDLDGARRVLARYAEVSPGDANVQDTLGDVHFQLGRFAEAEKYYVEAHRLNPAMLGGGDLYRAALGAYFAGDTRRADTHFANWLAIRKRGGDPVLAVREAVWEASTARVAQARMRLGQLVQVPGSTAELRAAAAAQLAVFDKAAGARAVAPVVPGNASAAVAQFLCQPDAAPQVWAQRAESLPAGVRAVLLGYALLLNGHFAQAVPVWRKTWESTHPTNDSDARVMLAWALSASGQGAEAKRLLARAPMPGRAAEPGLTFLTVLKYSELRR